MEYGCCALTTSIRDVLIIGGKREGGKGRREIMSVVAVVIGQMTVVVIRDHSFRLILTKYPMHRVTI